MDTQRVTNRLRIQRFQRALENDDRFNGGGLRENIQHSRQKILRRDDAADLRFGDAVNESLVVQIGVQSNDWKRLRHTSKRRYEPFSTRFRKDHHVLLVGETEAAQPETEQLHLPVHFFIGPPRVVAQHVLGENRSADLHFSLFCQYFSRSKRFLALVVFHGVVQAFH